MKIDISTILGIVIAVGLIITAISLGEDSNPLAFIDYPSLLIVLGGTFAVTTACFTVPEIIRAQPLILKTIFYSSANPSAMGIQLIELAEEARRNGILSLQDFYNSGQGGKFLRNGLGMVIDGMEPEAIERIMQQEIHSMSDRHQKGASILRKSAEVAPAMGLIGTLIGLVKMLGTLDDPSGIGPAMAIALLTTLYGAFLAYVIFTPLASKLERNSQEEILINNLYLKGLSAISKKENPRRLEMLINTVLPPEKRINYFDDGGDELE